MFNVPPNTL